MIQLRGGCGLRFPDRAGLYRVHSYDVTKLLTCTWQAKLVPV